MTVSLFAASGSGNDLGDLEWHVEHGEVAADDILSSGREFRKQLLAATLSAATNTGN